MNYPAHRSCRHSHHRITCEHQIELEVFPPAAEVYFADERYADAALSQARFDAVVFNAPTASVHWSVSAIGGGPGLGTIDQTGLYKAPPKGVLASGLTEVITAVSADNPDRKAFAFVSLIGKGPEPPPEKQILLSPKRCFLYYPLGHDNGHIDESNTRQVFRAIVGNTDDGIDWLVNGASVASGSRLYCYAVSGSGATKTVAITARLIHDHSVYDEALVVVGNYTWPGLH
jgi:hypothetical protein